MDHELWERVVERDARFLYYGGERLQGQALIRLDTWRILHPVICMVPYLEPTNRYPCSGSQTVDHVKDAPMMGRRAPDDPRHLIAMCEAHNIWHPPSKALRQAEREYLGRPDQEALPDVLQDGQRPGQEVEPPRPDLG
jgi:hypothetical protein